MTFRSLAMVHTCSPAWRRRDGACGLLTYLHDTHLGTASMHPLHASSKRAHAPRQGNTKSNPSDHHGEGGAYARPSTSPPFSPGSPLTYSPQIAMQRHFQEPISKSDDRGRPGGAEFNGVAGWPATVVPVVIVCEFSAHACHAEMHACFTVTYTYAC
eukprot:365255-Chlamydomonas_euryale.AAC.21